MEFNFTKLSSMFLVVLLSTAICGCIPNVLCISPPAFYIFGDSLADTGNNNYLPNSTSLANIPPYGETYFHYPTGRFTNGRTVFDFLASRLRLPFPPPYLKPGANFSKGINFASGGSGLLLSTGKEMNIIPLEVQIQQFTNISLKLAEEYGVDAAKSMIGRSLFAVSIGGNDLGLNYFVNATFQNSTSPQALIQMLLGKYSQYLTSLYRDGARNFLLFDMSPVGCTPNFRLAGLATWNGECVESGNQLAMAYNVGFKQLMMNITSILKEATILTTNTYSLTDNITRHGEDYGFSKVRSACCGAGPFNTA
ncbi:hypothetical protein KI387_015812, partial [Taxus chinensis]